MSTITTFVCDYDGCTLQTTQVGKGWQAIVGVGGPHKHYCPLHSSPRNDQIVSALHLSATELGLEGPDRNDFVQRLLRRLR